jgi:DNA-directed RNA polymerase specialized sigma subunit
LEAAARRFDPTRGVPFDAFARKLVAWTMDNYLTRGRIRVVGGAGWQ